jgi:DNA-binding transcriptional LysR family regulator
MDKLRAMTAFARIVDKGSLTAAAADLGLSLPSMVRTLAALERALGATLLNRTTRRIHLTDEGRQYLAHCRVVLAQVQEAEAALHSRRSEPRGHLVVTASVLFGRYYVRPLVTTFLASYPGVSAELLFLDRLVNLVEEGVDVAVRIGRLADSSLAAIALGHVRRVVCASPAYLRRHGTPRRPEDLRDHHCIRFTGLAPRAEWTFRAPARKVAVTSVLACNQAETAIDACTAGLGPGCFLSYMVAPLVRAGKLRYLLEDFEPEPQPVHLLYPYSRHRSPTVRAFADLCAERLKQTRFD